MSVSDEDRQRILSPQEQAAMNTDDYDPDEDNAAALAEIGRGTIAADDDAADDPAGKPAPGTEAPAGADDPAKATAAPPPAATPAAAPAAAQEPAAATPAPAPAAAPQAAPAYAAELPADYEDQVKANKTAMADLRKKLDDGELDRAEYDSQLDALQDKRDDLRDMKTRATMAAEMRQQSEQAAWQSAISTFMADAGKTPEMGIVDYLKDKAKQADLDTFVRALANAPENADKPYRWFLDEAHKRVVALHGIPTTKKPADPERRPDATAVVQNLAEVPGGAGDADPVANEFAEIDKLEGLDYERALRAMPADKRERYLRMS